MFSLSLEIVCYLNRDNSQEKMKKLGHQTKQNFLYYLKRLRFQW